MNKLEGTLGCLERDSKSTGLDLPQRIIISYITKNVNCVNKSILIPNFISYAYPYEPSLTISCRSNRLPILTEEISQQLTMLFDCPFCSSSLVRSNGLPIEYQMDQRGKEGSEEKRTRDYQRHVTM